MNTIKSQPKNWLITGGAGFIGTNLVLRLLANGDHVFVLDDLSRSGSQSNLSVLRESGLINFSQISIVNTQDLFIYCASLPSIDVVIHLAGQVSLMHSIVDPRHDFEVNALGTLNLLEACRKYWPESRLIFSSTNKVYGDLKRYSFVETETRYEPRDGTLSFTTNTQLDFHGGYGVSKGCADQYVIDYHRIYVLILCVYGNPQFAEDINILNRIKDGQRF